MFLLLIIGAFGTPIAATVVRVLKRLVSVPTAPVA